MPSKTTKRPAKRKPAGTKPKTPPSRFHLPTWLRPPKWLRRPQWLRLPAWLRLPKWLRLPAWLRIAKDKEERRKLRRKLLFNLALALIALPLLYILRLDYLINSKFSGNRWALPARVYAASVELYTGQTVTQDEIVRTLQAAGYQPAIAPAPGVRPAAAPGEYHRDGKRLDIHLRKFDYPDRQQPQQRVRVRFSDDRIQRITNLDAARRETLLRLEPELIGKIYPDNYEDRALLAYEDLPRALPQALLAVEDRHFFTHPGIDLRGITRAALANLRHGGIAQGGSTLTQQLVKNYFLTHDRTLWRKINEVVMALLLERRYDKEQILTAYCNEVFLGQQGKKSIHGFGTAAEYYFGRPLDELEIEQLALLVGMVKGASVYHPRRRPNRARARRDLVLEQMRQGGYLKEAETEAAMARPLGVTERPSWSYFRYPAFVQLLKKQLLRDYKPEQLRSEGLRIHTTLDSKLQKIARRETAAVLQNFDPKKGPEDKRLQSASVFARSSDGAVLALIGSRNPDLVGFNRALEAERQIGSLIKPFLFYTALRQDPALSLTSPVRDTDIELRQRDGDVWRPQNYDRRDHGTVTLLEALAMSYNKASVRLGKQAGTRHLIGTLRDLGLKQEIGEYDSLLLGAINLTPLEVAQLYQTVANGGFRVPLNTITEVLDRDGKPLQRYAIEAGQALDPEINFLLNYMLVQAARHGTARDLADYPGLAQAFAGKTGTSNALRDSWFTGFGDNVSGVTWIGRDDNSVTGLSGATGAMVLWARIMSAYGGGSLNLLAPPGIAWTRGVRAQFHDVCVDLDKVPYLGAARPRSDPQC